MTLHSMKVVRVAAGLVIAVTSGCQMHVRLALQLITGALQAGLICQQSLLRVCKGYQQMPSEPVERVPQRGTDLGMESLPGLQLPEQGIPSSSEKGQQCAKPCHTL